MAAFSVTKPTISQHLAILREAGLVTARAVGTSRLYRARPQELGGLRAALISPTKWSNADDAPERDLSSAQTKLVVVASTDVSTSQPLTFGAFSFPFQVQGAGHVLPLDNVRSYYLGKLQDRELAHDGWVRASGAGQDAEFNIRGRFIRTRTRRSISPGGDIRRMERTTSRAYSATKRTPDAAA